MDRIGVAYTRYSIYAVARKNVLRMEVPQDTCVKYSKMYMKIGLDMDRNLTALRRVHNYNSF